MTGPQRIQLRRTKGWRKPTGAVVVSRPSKWGNPWRIGDGYEISVEPRLSKPEPNGRVVGPGLVMVSAFVDSPALAVALYRPWVTVSYTEDEIRGELAGHDLACWCPLVDSHGKRVPCHADVLLEIANPQTEKTQQ